MQLYHQFTAQETALLITMSVKGHARECLELLETRDLQQDDALEMVWRLLDNAHEKLAHERADEAYANWESAHRKPSQSMIRLVHQSATLLHWWASVAPVKTVGRRCGLREYLCTALRVGLFVCLYRFGSRCRCRCVLRQCA
jgi:hypothetical protein